MSAVEGCLLNRVPLYLHTHLSILQYPSMWLKEVESGCGTWGNFMFPAFKLTPDKDGTHAGGMHNMLGCKMYTTVVLCQSTSKMLIMKSYPF